MTTSSGIEPGYVDLFAFQLQKIAELDFIYTLASTDINQLAPHQVKMFMPIRSWMSLIMGSIGQEKQELFAFELRKISELVFVYTLAFAKYRPISTKLSAP